MNDCICNNCNRFIDCKDGVGDHVNEPCRIRYDYCIHCIEGLND